MPQLPASTALAPFSVLDLTRVRAGPTIRRRLAAAIGRPDRALRPEFEDGLARAANRVARNAET